MPRFNEIELQGTSAPLEESPTAVAPPLLRASRWRRAVVLLIDLSLFVALGVAMTPLLPAEGDLLRRHPAPAAGLAGFLLLISFYYFVPCWFVWGKTIGGAIMEVRVVETDGTPAHFASASRRWAGMLLSLALAGLGFMIAILPGARSLPDLVSRTTPIPSD